MKESGEEKLYTKVFKQIRNYIIEKQLKPGDYLPTEQVLYTQLGVSRNVLREAIKSMELMGMVESCAGRGTVVKEFNLDSIFENTLLFSSASHGYGLEELFGIRRSLELAYLPQIFVSVDEVGLQDIRNLAEGMADLWNERKAFWEADRRFHLALLKPLKNNALLSLMSAIWNTCEFVDQAGAEESVQKAMEEHEGILQALETRNYDAFAFAMQKHSFFGI